MASGLGTSSATLLTTAHSKGVRGGGKRERMFCSTSSSGLGRMESFADNSSSRRLRSNSA